MRLIYIHTLEIDEFFGDKIPPYLILSHTWEDEELKFEDWQESDDAKRTAIRQRKGYFKIFNACKFVRDGLSSPSEYIWIDTVCIDKRSSAELSEAINSMFDWYARSQRRIVYMSDVVTDVPIPQSSTGGKTELPSHVRTQFLGSRWFTRGWTLQELLAPAALLYVSGHWTILGTSDDLRQLVSKASGIPEKILRGTELSGIAAIHKMRWASRRRTTRLEDTAYSLMGIFNVNMPLIYGEGSKAFRRLQLEIIKESNDHSLFLWDIDRRGTSIFAPSPQAFESKHSRLSKKSMALSTSRPYYMTNNGLCMTLPLLKTADDRVFLAIMDFITPDHAQYCLILSQGFSDQWFAFGAIPVAFPRFLDEGLGTQYRKVYLQATDSACLTHSPRASLTHLNGHSFMFTYIWKFSNTSVADVVVIDDGRWLPVSIKSQPVGMLKLHRTKHAQALVIRFSNDETKEVFWYAIIYHDEYSWFVYPMGSKSPRFGNYDRLTEDILERINMFSSPVQKENIMSHILAAHNSGKHFFVTICKPSWPSWPVFYQREGFAQCPVIFLQIGE